MRINDPRNVYGEKLLTETDASNTFLTKNTASSTYLSQSTASSTYATKSALTPLATKTEVANTYLTQNDASSTYLSQASASSTYATKESLNPLATKDEVSTKADKSEMELKADKITLDTKADKSQLETKVDNSSLVSNTIKVTKENTNDIITITSSDVADIINWEIYKITGTLTDGTVVSLIADAVISADGLTINLGDGSGRSTGITSVDIKLIRENSQGVEEVIPIEVLLSTGLATNSIAMLNMAVDKVIATGSKEEIQAVGAQLAQSVIDDYTLAGAKTYQEALEIMTTGVGNLGAFSNPIASYDKWDCLVLNDTDFKYNMMSLETGGENGCIGMFRDSNITSFTSKLGSLTDASYMFYNCYGLTSQTAELPHSLSNTSFMFQYCTGLTSWTVELPESLTYAESMFSGCSGLTSWTVELPESLKYARNMFNGCSGLTSWTIELPESLTSASGMFSDCSGLTSWTVALPESLTGAESMFQGCTGLTSWNVPLPETLTNASNMFAYCTGLTSWDVALPQSLTNTSSMFYSCINLTSFTPWGKNEDDTLKDTGIAGNLARGYQMFHLCKLDLASVKRIADWLPQRSSSKPTDSENWKAQDGWIHIGVAQGVNSGDEFNNAISKMTGKNWSVVICVNGSHTTK